MELPYYPETDSLHIELNPTVSAETRESSDGVNVDLDRESAVVGIDIDRASKRLDLSTVEINELPFRIAKAA